MAAILAMVKIMAAILAITIILTLVYVAWASNSEYRSAENNCKLAGYDAVESTSNGFACHNYTIEERIAQNKVKHFHE